MVIKLENKINNDHYYRESVRETPYILENILKSDYQNLYREYLSKYRDLDKKALEESYMFYILDGEDELESVMPDEYFQELLGIRTADFIRQKERFVLPIFDARKTILGFVGYDYDKSKYKYLITLSRFADKENIFYNMQNLNYAYRQDVVIVEEGTFDSIRLNSLGYKNNLCLLGKRMTDFHVNLLSRFSLVILIPDNDGPGMESHKIWVKQLKDKTRVATMYINKSKMTKKTIDVETQEPIELEITTKDLDNYLSNERNQVKFRQTYKKILKDYDNPLINNKKYSL